MILYRIILYILHLHHISKVSGIERGYGKTPRYKGILKAHIRLAGNNKGLGDLKEGTGKGIEHMVHTEVLKTLGSMRETSD